MTTEAVKNLDALAHLFIRSANTTEADVKNQRTVDAMLTIVASLFKNGARPSINIATSVIASTDSAVNAAFSRLNGAGLRCHPSTSQAYLDKKLIAQYRKLLAIVEVNGPSY